MSFLDSLTGGENAGASPMELVGGLINHAGGLQGLIDTLKRGGLRSQVESWISGGANQAVESGQLQQAIVNTPLGAHVQELAQKMGVDTNQVLGQLAQHLPGAIDHLTPSGQLPDAEADLSKLQGLAAKLGL